MSDSTMPERIWLQIGYGDEGTHTWCQDETEWEPQIKYIRSDRYEDAIQQYFDLKQKYDDLVIAPVVQDIDALKKDIHPKDQRVQTVAYRMGWNCCINHLKAIGRISPTPSADPQDDARVKAWNSSTFKGADAIYRFAEANEFWEKQPYGTRLYFGESAFDYLHRGLVQCAAIFLKQQEQAALQQPPTASAQPVVPVVSKEAARKALIECNKCLDEHDGMQRFTSAELKTVQAALKHFAGE